MSDWLRLQSELKRRPVDQYLTLSQREIRDKICHLLRFPNRINLYGPHGSGKTVAAWAIAQATGAIHLVLPEDLFSISLDQSIVLVDNAPYNESDVRRLLAGTNIRGISSVVLVTTRPAELPMHRVVLPRPNDSEIQSTLETYARFGFYQQRDLSSNPNFWDIMRACI